MKSLIKKHINTNRTPVSDASNSLVEDVAKELNAEILKAQSGSEVLTWVIPEYFNCKKAVLQSLNGEVVVDFNNNPLYLWTNSKSFQGNISRQDLESHIMTDETRPDAIPYHYKQGFQERAENWGFCIPYNIYKTMQYSEYYVHIDAELNNSKEMYTGIATVGSGGDTYIFAAHTCHPAQATDGLTNVALLMELFKKLSTMELKNTYKFVFGPEYYAAAVFLDRLDDNELKKIKGAFFLDIIGSNTKLAFSSSFQGDSYVDKVTEHIFKYKVKDYHKYGYRDLLGNDEMFYNGPYFNIPTVTLAQESPDKYHTSLDNYENIDFKVIDLYYELLLNIINIFETNFTPVLKYKGPLFLSKYNLYYDRIACENAYKIIETIQILSDGRHTCFDLAEKSNADYDFVLDFYNQLLHHNLIRKG